MRCRPLRQIFCSFTTSFPRCSVARFPAATLGTFTAVSLHPFPLTQPSSPDQPTKQTCLYQSFSSHSFIPVQTPCTSAHYPLRSPPCTFYYSSLHLSVFSQVVCICCAPSPTSPPLPTQTTLSLGLWIYRMTRRTCSDSILYALFLSLTLPSASRYLPLRSPHVPDVCSVRLLSMRPDTLVE
ncbi:hypothetical protein K523DRAFT_122097 [Schizophyllum commune Tattone D]|nr:hypothetical protein K523DRAFT_122097 [Schizophyllum commune Tattone D]